MYANSPPGFEPNESVQNCTEYTLMQGTEVYAIFLNIWASFRFHNREATGSHFNLPGHSKWDLKITVIEKVHDREVWVREERESLFIRNSNTYYKGMNRKPQFLITKNLHVLFCFPYPSKLNPACFSFFLLYETTIIIYHSNYYLYYFKLIPNYFRVDPKSVVKLLCFAFSLQS